jgi:hypothetical protein
MTDLKGRRASPDLPARKVLLARREHKERPEPRDRQDQQGHKDQWAIPTFRH